MRAPRPALALACLLLACSSQPSPDAGGDRPRPRFDRGADRQGDRATEASIDAATVCDAAQIGKPCSGPAGCAPGHPCVVAAPGAGFCSCPCKPDDPGTVLENEDSCPQQPDHRCAALPSTGGAFCVRTCKPRLGSSDCQAPLACRPESGESLGLSGLTACVLRGCQAAADCPVLTAAPCGPAAPCPSGQTCVPQPVGPAWCALPGACDLPSGLCKAHSLGLATAKVGDPCASDLDCAGSMHCLRELDRAKLLAPAGASCGSAVECCSGACLAGHCADRPCPALYRNGYCTIAGCRFASTLAERACPVGSTCNRYHQAGLCQRICDPQKPEQCRDHPADRFGDYECRNWSNLLLDKEPVTLDSVCDFGPLIACDALAADGLGCNVFGVDTLFGTNITHMRCRTLQGATTTDPMDPKGFCLDDSASGPP